MTDQAERNYLSVPSYLVANFAARISEIQGGRLQQLIQDALASESAIEDLSQLKDSVGLSPGKELFTQEIPIAADFLRIVDQDPRLRNLWLGVTGDAQTYSGIDLVREGFELIKDIEHYLLWTALGLRFINFRIGIETKTGPATKAEFSVGTNGITLAFKKQVDLFFHESEKDIGSILVSADPQRTELVGRNGENESQLIVESIRDTRVPETDTSLVSGLMQGDLIQIGSLFSVKKDSEAHRIETLAKIASLYWEVNNPPSSGDGVPFTFETVFGIKEGKLSAADRKLADEWPRGFKIDVGEEFLEDEKTWPFVSVISPKTIQGSQAKQYSNFLPSKAGRIAEFIKSYLGFEEVKIYFSRNAKALHIQAGVRCRVGRTGSDVRGLVLDRAGSRWAIIPGHAVLTASTRGKTIPALIESCKGDRLVVDYNDSAGSRLREVGQIQRAYLTESYEYGQSKRRAIDAAFCNLDPLASSSGFGQYVTLAPAIAGALISDWNDFRGRYIVTLDEDNRVRWSRVSAHLASKHLESAISGHRFIVKNALQVQSVGALPFAEPGMSGSLAFLTPDGSRPGQPIKSEIGLIGYIIGRSRYHSVDTGGDYLQLNKKNASIPEDFTIQLLNDVGVEFNAFINETNIGSLLSEAE